MYVETLCNAVCGMCRGCAGCHAGSAGEVTRWSAAASRRVTQCYTVLRHTGHMSQCPAQCSLYTSDQVPYVVCRDPAPLCSARDSSGQTHRNIRTKYRVAFNQFWPLLPDLFLLLWPAFIYRRATLAKYVLDVGICSV